MPPLKLPFMFSPIYRINVIADVCHGKVFLPQGLPGGRSVPHDWTQCNFACITLRRRTCGSAVLCDESLCYFPGRNRSPPFQICSSLLAQISPGSGKKARERARVKICPTCRRHACVCVFGEIDIFFFLLFSRLRVSAGIHSKTSWGSETRFRGLLVHVGGGRQFDNPCGSAKGLACGRRVCVFGQTIRKLE